MVATCPFTSEASMSFEPPSMKDENEAVTFWTWGLTKNRLYAGEIVRCQNCGKQADLFYIDGKTLCQDCQQKKDQDKKNTQIISAWEKPESKKQR